MRSGRQRIAALRLATGLPDAKKRYFLAPEVGHYGIFNGSKWRTRIAPVLEEFIGAVPGKTKLAAVA